MKRRDFIKKAGKAAALAAITGATGYYFHDRDMTAYVAAITKSRSFEIPKDINFPVVALAKNEEHIVALNRALDAVGGIGRFVKSGEKVTIKPNVAWDRTPEQGANTNPVLVAEMVRLCLSAGAAEVIVSDITCNDPRRTFLRSGIKEAAEKAGAKVYLEADEDFLTFDIGGQILGKWPVLKHFVRTDRLINMPIVKHHSLSECTIGMKNLYGIIGGRRSQLHQHIDQSIVDLTAFCRPTLTVVDATRVMHRGGPQGGSLADVTIENSIICSTDLVAADSRGCEFLGLSGDIVGHISLAHKAGLGEIDYNKAGYKEIV
jgi:uncharacterized protein (DUF362 family)